MSIICSVFGACLTLSGMAQVHDGDTISIKHQYIRLYGIDAEELDEPHGYQAREALVRIINNAPVTCTHTGENSYHRIIARCRTSEGKDIGEELVRAGVVLDCRRYSGGRYARYEPSHARTTLLQKPYCDPNFKR
jgi:endonuclease YncB( thermonuclease family)